MFKITDYVELLRLLEEAEAVEQGLMPNELEMLRSLKAKYAEPLNVDPFDVTGLNVMLRNVEIRKGYNFDPKKDAGRVIDLPRAEDTKNSTGGGQN
jgi:hypothetical protein